VNVETGSHDPAGATLFAIPDEWERRNVRQEMITAAQGLIEHLNEHVEFYHKAIWWSMDRDRLFMMIDGFYIPATDGVSIASVVERDPIAIIGNSIVFRVAAGAFLGLGDIKDAAALYNHYVSGQPPLEPMLVSLPTDGLYAQSVMDECEALEEHFGSTDWALNDPDPELGTIAPELLASRRADPMATTPTPLPATIISLQNAPEAPAPAGLSGALAAVQNANAFRDMAGLVGTQQNAAAGFQAAAALASSFGAQAAALKLADMAGKAHAAQTTDQKLASIQRAADKNLVTPQDAQNHASKVLDDLHTTFAGSSDIAPAVIDRITQGNLTSLKTSGSDGTVEAEWAAPDGGAGGGSGGGGTGVPEIKAAPFGAPYFPGFVSDPSFSACITDPGDLDIAVVDVTDPAAPVYAGIRDNKAVFAASMAKAAALYAAFELRGGIRRALKDIPTNVPVADVFTAIQKKWQPLLDVNNPADSRAFKGFPRLKDIFDVAPNATGTGWTVEFKTSGTIGNLSDPENDTFAAIEAGGFGFKELLELMGRYSNDEAAARCITTLSYEYIHSALIASGLYREVDGGFWLGAPYAAAPSGTSGADERNKLWMPEPLNNDPNTSRRFQVASAKAAATMFTLLAQGALVDSDSSNNGMLPFLDPKTSDFVKTALVNDGRAVVSVHTKIGVIKNSYWCQTSLVERKLKDATTHKTIRYVVSIMNNKAPFRLDKTVVGPIDDCILARHPGATPIP
jgi:hypothetical protein